MRPRAFLLLLFLGSASGMSTLRPAVEMNEITSTEMTTGMTSMDEDQGSGLLEDELTEIYWSGTAPFCFGGCRGRHRELKKDACGDSSCCWLGYKSLCRVNCGLPDVDFNGVVYGNDWWVGSMVRHECRSGFILVGEPTSTCQSNGKWTAKPSCLRVCRKGQVEINERDIDEECTSTCPSKYLVSIKHGCSFIDHCRIKDSGWKHWFTRCTHCECDCFIPCASAG
ncbi:C4b-binding protein alpha chain [Ictalurus punctatus]|uniref:C4b-binding protein alpha chain n=1 Tax=Ictalurus punctatus TaxID=7998 RepID=A0A2D0Q9J9_ICTPU|nr:C4b-binding protein alpha chain [Ictalurus punctatus]